MVPEHITVYQHALIHGEPLNTVVGEISKVASKATKLSPARSRLLSAREMTRERDREGNPGRSIIKSHVNVSWAREGLGTGSACLPTTGLRVVGSTTNYVVLEYTISRPLHSQKTSGGSLLQGEKGGRLPDNYVWDLVSLFACVRKRSRQSATP